MANQKNPPSCSFCSRGEGQVNMLIPGPRGVYICDQCATLCYDLVEEYSEKKKETKKEFRPDYLDRKSVV